MPKSFAHGLGDLAGDDIRRWRGDGPDTTVTNSLSWAERLWVRLETMLMERLCRRSMRRALALRPVLVSDPSPTHASFHHPKPN